MFALPPFFTSISTPSKNYSTFKLTYIFRSMFCTEAIDKLKSMSYFIPDYRTVAGDRDYEDVRVVAKDITETE